MKKIILYIDGKYCNTFYPDESKDLEIYLNSPTYKIQIDDRNCYERKPDFKESDD